LNADPELSILLAREAERRAPTSQSEDALRIALARSSARLSVGTGAPVKSLAISPDSATFATGASDGVARIWEASTGRQMIELVGTNGPIEAIAFSPDGKRVVASSPADRVQRIWDARSGGLLAELRAPVGGAAVAFRPHGDLL